MPFAILSIFVLLWGLPSVKLAMNKATTPAFRVVLPNGKVRPGPPGWNVPYLHNAVYRSAPVVTKPTPEAARYDFNWLSATGTRMFPGSDRRWLAAWPKPSAPHENFLAHTWCACGWP